MVDDLATLTRQYLQAAWVNKTHYSYTWLGAPIVQLPDDLVRLQEVILKIRPAVIIETGVAMGGSMLLYASLCQLLEHGRVIGVDHHIRDEAKAHIAAWPSLANRIHLIEGDSTAAETIAAVHAHVGDTSPTLVILDSAHHATHVYAELNAYAPLVSIGSYIIVADGCLQDMADVPRGKTRWRDDNPLIAVQRFLAENPHFQYNPPSPQSHLSHLSGGWLQRIS